tara:strand:- start:19 stop:294 length:276 start_codon:yes stop_codon:yes gene_type:complete
MAKKNKKFELEQIKRIVSDAAVDAFISYNVEFDFHGYDRDVRTVYVKEHVGSPNSVEFYMLKEMEEEIRKINSRYSVGILYQEREKKEEEY